MNRSNRVDKCCKERKKYGTMVIDVLLAFSVIFVVSGCAGSGSEDANEKFEEYTREVFCSEVSSDTVSLHYTLKEPEAYGIREPEATFGDVITDENSIRASAENIRQALLASDFDSLTTENQLTYELLNYRSRMMQKAADYLYFEEPFGTVSGIQTQLPVVLSEYQFYDTEDVDTYLALASTVEEYFDQLISFERRKADEGLFMPEYMAETVYEQCMAFLDMGERNYLYSTFADRIKEMDGLTEEEKSDYVMDNARIVNDFIYPAYQKLADAMQELKTAGVNEKGLAGVQGGAEYYEYLVRRYTGTDCSVEELEEMTREQISDDITAMQQAAGISVNDTEEAMASVGRESAEYMIAFLREEIQETFPEVPDTRLDIKYVSKEMQEHISPAFYMIPAIDNLSENVIYINQAHVGDQLSLFTTLAHEGYPGHLYQTLYFESTEPDPIRSLMDFPGYVEGWATYAEMGSYFLLPLSKAESTFLQKNSSVLLGLYALADMGIHYEGWSRMETAAFFSGYGITDTDAIERIYELIIGSPGNYLKYYIGYVEFLQLKEQWIEKKESGFLQKDFHQAVLEVGPAPFALVEKYMWKMEKE